MERVGAFVAEHDDIMAISHFVAPLRCLDCGTTASDTLATWMQTRLGDEPWQVYRVGDTVPSTPVDLEDAYLAAHPLEGDPATAEIHVLQHWGCPTCHTWQWAEVVIVGGRVASISTAGLTRAVVERAHFVSDEISETYAARVGPLFDGVHHDPDFARKLAATLPDE